MSNPVPSAPKQPKIKYSAEKKQLIHRKLAEINNMEDNPKTIINVAGDYVQSKHVDYEINNVQPGAIGAQTTKD